MWVEYLYGWGVAIWRRVDLECICVSSVDRSHSGDIKRGLDWISEACHSPWICLYWYKECKQNVSVSEVWWFGEGWVLNRCMFVHLTKIMVTLRACWVSAAGLFAMILSQSFTSGFLQTNVVVLQIHLFFIFLLLWQHSWLASLMMCLIFILWAGWATQSPCTEEDFLIFGFAFLTFPSGRHVKWIRKNNQFEAEYNNVNI